MSKHRLLHHKTRPGYGAVRRGGRAGELRYYKPLEGDQNPEPISGEEKGHRHQVHKDKDTRRGENRNKHFDSGFRKARG